jgi:hypothetical protein
LLLVRRWLAECYTHDNKVVEWTCRYDLVLVDVNVARGRACKLSSLSRSLAPLSCGSHRPPPTTLFFKQPTSLSHRNETPNRATLPVPTIFCQVLTPAIGSIWVINTTIIDIPTAKPATMGDVGDEEELDLNNPPFPLTAIDREILATRDEDYHRTTWSDLKQIIGTATSDHVRSFEMSILTCPPSKQRTRTTQTPPVRSAQIPPLVVQDQESVRKHHEFRCPGTACLDAQRRRSACHGTLFHTPFVCTF